MSLISQKIPRQNRFMQRLMKTESWSLWHIFSTLTPALKICRRQLSLFLQDEATNIFKGLKDMWLAHCVCWLSSYGGGGGGQWLPAVVKTLSENYSSKIRNIKHNQLRPLCGIASNIIYIYPILFRFYVYVL